MKKHFLAFTLVAAVLATFLAGCDDDTNGPSCFDFDSAVDTGSHKVYLGIVAAPLNPIHDSLVGSVSGSDITISSQALNRNLTGTLDPSNCNKIIMDSVLFGPNDTLFIETTLPIPGGFVKIWGIEAGGTGQASGSTITTSIKVKKGFTNITSPIDLSNLQGKNLELRGTFVPYP